ncbi:MAG: AMP-binding protein [Pseudomonadota bacterium]
MTPSETLAEDGGPALPTPFETFHGAVAAAAAAHPDKPFLCAPPRPGRAYLPDGAEWRYGEVVAAVDVLAERYAAAGWGPGHRVVLALDNHPAHFLHFLALNKIGAGEAAANPHYLLDEMRYFLTHSESALAVAAPWNVAKLREAAPDLPILSWDDGSAPGAFAPPPPPTPRREEAPGLGTEAALFYTSGTTARPKGCIIDNAYILGGAAWYRDAGGALALGIGEERVYNPLPAFHMNGGAVTPCALALTGNCLILPDRFHAETWWDDLIATRATGMHYLGIIPPVLMKAPPSPQDRAHGVRFGLGAGIDPSLHAAFEARFGSEMVEVWGMTETGRCYAASHAPRGVGARAFGRPYAGMEAIVAGPDGKELPRGREGEMLVRSPGPDPRRFFFRGYLKNEAATEEAWQGGWFHTGDVVRQDADGMLHFVERAKNIIRRSGENISAAEVEAALIEHPGLRAVAVLAVPDALRDEEVMACLVAADGAEAGEALARDALAFAADRLAYYKVPGWAAFLDALPVTGTNKVQKHALFGKGADPREDPRALDLRETKAALRRAKAS